MKSLKQILDYYADLKNCDADLFGTPDPLQVAKGHRNDVVALICALFAYGSAAQILKFLRSLDFSLLARSLRAKNIDFKARATSLKFL